MSEIEDKTEKKAILDLRDGKCSINMIGIIIDIAIFKIIHD